jgi:ABC-type sugar transport system substrate-binding protein
MNVRRFAKTLCLGLAFTLVLVVSAGCGAADKDTPEDSNKVGFILADLSNEFFAYYGNSIKTALGDEGYDVVLASYGGEVTKAIEQIETFTNQGVKAIMMMGTTPDLADSLKAAREAGVKVLLAGNDIEGAYDVCLVSDNTQIGGLVGDMAAGHYNSVLQDDNAAEVLAVVYSYGGVDLANRSNAMVDTFKEKTGIDESKLHVEEFTTDGGDTTGQAFLENALTKYPNVKIVMTFSDSVGLVALNIMKASGMTGDEYAVYGSDATTQALLEIAQVNGPSIYRGSVSMGDIVSQTTENALKLLRDEFETTPYRVEGPGVPVTAENAAMFLPQE